MHVLSSPYYKEYEKILWASNEITKNMLGLMESMKGYWQDSMGESTFQSICVTSLFEILIFFYQLSGNDRQSCINEIMMHLDNFVKNPNPFELRPDIPLN